MPEHMRARKVAPPASVHLAMDRRQRGALASRAATADGSHPVPLQAERADLLERDFSGIRVHHTGAAELGAVDAPAATDAEQVTVAPQASSARRVARELARVAQLRRGGVPVDTGRGGEPGSPSQGEAGHAAHPVSRGPAATMAVGGPGQALPSSLRDRLAPLVGSHAVNATRVHTDAVAEDHAAGRRALAVAHGNDVFFARGHYRPGTPDGDRLIAHEVAHVDQAQRDLLRRPAYYLASGSSSAPLELAADQVASKLDQDTDRGSASGVPPPGTRPQATSGGAEPSLVGTTPGKAVTDDGQAPAKAEATKAESAAAMPDQEGPEAKGPGTEGPVQAPGQATPPPALPPGLPLMPAPAMTLSTPEQARVTRVRHRTHAASKATTAVPPARANVAAAQAAVQVPQSENNARKAEQVVADLGAREKPSVEIVALGDRIRRLIRAKRPPDEDGVIDTRPQQVAAEAGKGVAEGVQRDVDATKNSYASIAASPRGPPVPTPPVIEPIPGAGPSPEIAAATAAPDAIPADQISLDKDAAGMTAKAHDAGLDSEPAQLVTSGPIADARAAQGDMRQLAGTAPQEAIRQQQAALEKASAGMAGLQAAALASLREARAGHASSVAAQQASVKDGEEALRARLSKQADDIYADTQRRVEEQLQAVPETAMSKWDAGLAPLTRVFNDDLKAVKDKIEERHSGVGGFFVAGWDAVTGLPGWVTAAYDVAEKNFGDGVAALLTDISSDVNTVIKIADKIIDGAREDIHRIFTTSLPDGQRKWAEQQVKEFDKKLNGLHEKAETTRVSFNKDLIRSAGDAVQAAREKVQELRVEASGLWGRFLDAVDRFRKDPVKFIIDGLLDVVGISPRDFWAVVDKVRSVVSDIAEYPVRFAGNLMEGVGAGFTLFFSKIDEHLFKGLLEWLLRGLRQAGISIEIPREITLRSVLGFFLELLGISWARIRKLLVAELGEQSVALIEKSVRVIQTLAAKGISGIIDDIKAMLDPKTLIDNIIHAAVTFVTERLIVQVAKKILLMLNPVGAVLAAIEAIYRVLKWIFHNAARIFRLIEAVVNGVADIIAGNTGGVAKMIDTALAAMIAPVIDFLADYFGLGDLPAKVAEALKGLQAWVEESLRVVIKWLVAIGKKTLAALGVKGAAGKTDKAPRADHEEIGIHVPFEGGGEAHEIYIEVTGTDAMVIIQSRKSSVEKWLDERITELREKKPFKGKKAQEANSLISNAKNLYTLTRKAAEARRAARAAAKKQAGTASQGKDGPQESAVEQDEKALAVALKKVADLFGTLSPLEVDPRLKAAVKTAGSVVNFMRLLARKKRQAGEVTYGLFVELWSQKANREWLKAGFRGEGEEEGMHEWIPTNYIPKTIADADNLNDFTDADAWIDLHHELRSDTRLLIFTPDRWIPPKNGPKASRIPQGHVGAISSDGDPQFVGQGKFHGALRAAFNASKGIHSCIAGIERVLDDWIWDGKGRVPPIYRGVRGGRGGRPLDRGNIGDYQRENYSEIKQTFKAIKTKFSGTKT